MTRPPGVDWVHYAVDTGIPWPAEETAVDFLGYQIILRPSGDDGTAPDIRMRLAPSMTDVDGIRIVLQFLSMLSWWHQAPARIDLGAVSNHPFRFRIHCLPPPKCRDFTLPTECRYPSDPKAQLAIALYREAMSVNNVFYRFLGFFKIINCYFDDKGRDQREWINSTIPLLSEHKAVKRINHHQSNGMTNYANHLYRECRSAIAHASVKKHTNPDDPSDLRRIEAELPIVQELAIHLIERELGVRNQFTRLWCFS